MSQKKKEKEKGTCRKTQQCPSSATVRIVNVVSTGNLQNGECKFNLKGAGNPDRQHHSVLASWSSASASADLDATARLPPPLLNEVQKLRCETNNKNNKCGGGFAVKADVSARKPSQPSRTQKTAKRFADHGFVS